MSEPTLTPPQGKLGVLTPGMGAVATTFISGVMAARKGYAEPTGSLTQMAHIRLGRRTDERNPLIRDFVPLADLDDLEFGGWDPYSDDAYTAAMKAGVLDARHIEGIGDELRAVRPMSAVPGSSTLATSKASATSYGQYGQCQPSSHPVGSETSTGSTRSRSQPEL